MKIHPTDKRFLGALLSILGYADNVIGHFDWEESVTYIAAHENVHTQERFATLKQFYESR